MGCNSSTMTGDPSRVPAKAEKKSAKPVVFGFWAVRGGASGNPTRYMLNYAGVNYEEKTYTFDKKQIWAEDKKAGMENGFDWMNLPYLVDGDLKISEVMAIQ